MVKKSASLLMVQQSARLPMVKKYASLPMTARLVGKYMVKVRLVLSESLGFS